MDVSLLVSERALRARLIKCIGAPELVASEYGTADKALPGLLYRPCDLVVMHWKVHPASIRRDTPPNPGPRMPTGVLIYWKIWQGCPAPGQRASGR